jgi:putative membrane protein
MVTDHSKAGDELKSIAIQSKITLPADVSKSDAETYAKLSKLSGAEFDRAYANEMLKDQRWRNFKRKRWAARIRL